MRYRNHCVLLCYRKQPHHQRSNFNAEGLKYSPHSIGRQKRMTVPQTVDIGTHISWKASYSILPPCGSFGAMLNRSLQS